MPRKLLWKVLLIVAVCALSAWLIYPVDERINLGLDLQGGSYIVMQIHTETAIKYEMDLTQSRIGQALKERGVTYGAILPRGTTTLEIQGVDPARRGDVREVLDQQVGQWEIRDGGGGAWTVTMPPPYVTLVERNAMETTLTTIRTRVNELGVKEPIVSAQGAKGDRILVMLPGVEDPERAKDIIQTSDVLEWKAVSYPPGVADFGNWSPPADREALAAQFGGALPPDTDLFPQKFPAAQGGGMVTIWWPLKRVSVVVGNDLQSAHRGVTNFGEPTVDFTLTQDAGRRFAAATRENVGRRMAIVLGSPTSKNVVSAPVIRDEISDRGQISGNFTVESAEDLALTLRSGAIPTEVSIIEERTIGPSLGRDSIRAGVTASLAGFLLVMIAMLAYYRLSGVNAVVALLMNALLLLGAMAYLGSDLTLPGIAGLILSIGMAVDSNVLIFERIREELRAGKTVRSAVDQGFSRAFLTILDCHITTLVSAFFLFSYGTGPVRGFAVTLTIGLIVSMFTAVFVSHVLYHLILGEGRRVESLSI